MPPLQPLLPRIPMPLQIRRIRRIHPPTRTLPRRRRNRRRMRMQSSMMMRRRRRAMAHKPIMLIDASLAPHAHALDLAQLAEREPADERGGAEAEARDAREAEVGFLDEVLEVHAVEGGAEGAEGEAEGADAEFEVEQHEGVAVRVEDCFDAVKRTGLG
ncbi:hypothetical protein KEM56_005912 [Ascosphaera pollenicola]|nr:hypothetical protein KEM56_005912 [Ascosphaera pollenicola]